MLETVLKFGRPVILLLARLPVVCEVLCGVVLPGIRMLQQKQVTSSPVLSKLLCM